MPSSFAAASAIALLLAAPALAQHSRGSDDDNPDRSIHLELGGGWMLSDPLGADDLEGPSGPTIDVALTRWTDRTGLVVGSRRSSASRRTSTPHGITPARSGKSSCPSRTSTRMWAGAVAG